MAVAFAGARAAIVGVRIDRKVDRIRHDSVRAHHRDRNGSLEFATSAAGTTTVMVNGTTVAGVQRDGSERDGVACREDAFPQSSG